MIALSQSRQQQIKSALLPPYHKARRGELNLLKSSSIVQQIDLNQILEENERRLNSTRSSSFRQTQQMSFIKDKFRRMIELQNRNFMERSQLQKEREAILREQEERAKDKVNRVKDQRSHNGEAGRNWRVRNMQEGAIIRQRKLQNQWQMTKRDCDELKDRQQMISDRHKSMMATHGKALQARNQLSIKRRLKVSQEYRWGLIRQLSQLVTPRANKQQQGDIGRQQQGGVGDVMI